MASSDELAALFGIGSPQEQIIAKEDPFLGFQREVADPIGNAIQTMPGLSLKTRLLTGLLAGIASGTASGLSKPYQEEQKNAYSDAISQSLGVSTEPGRPSPSDVLSPRLIGDANRQADLFRRANIFKQAEELRQFNLQGEGKFRDALLSQGKMVDAKGQIVAIPQLDPATIEANKKIAGIKAENSLYGNGDLSGSPLNPLNEKKRTLEKEARDSLKTTPMVTNFGDLKSSFDTMVSTYKFNDRPGTFTFISSFARLLDPNSVVREGEIKNAENTQTFLSSLGYKLSSLIDGTQQIEPAAKQQMLRAAASKYNQYGDQYVGYLQKQQDLIEKQGGDRSNVFGPFDYKPFDFADWAKSPEVVQTTLEEDIGDPIANESNAKLTSILAKAQSGAPITWQDQVEIAKARKLLGGPQ